MVESGEIASANAPRRDAGACRGFGLRRSQVLRRSGDRGEMPLSFALVGQTPPLWTIS